jgi:hypothetical protein
MWVACGIGLLYGLLVWSEDGKLWNTVPNLTFISFRAVACNGSMWVAGGTEISAFNTTMFFSEDGINWNVAANPSFSCYTIACNGSRWIAGGNGPNKLAWSSDGKSWSSDGIANLDFNCFAIACNGSMWVAGGGDATSQNTLAYSTDDGKTWNPLGKTIFSKGCRAVAWNGSMWVAGGQGTNKLAWSLDGITWNNELNNPSIFSIYCRAVAWNGSRWIAGGGDATSQNTLAWSSDGKTWIGLGKTVFSTACVALACRNV